MVDVPFSKFGYAVVNVKNPIYAGGAQGNGADDDVLPIQAAINAAFGSSGAPHGLNSWQNRPLYFPHGRYILSAPLVLTQVKGGLIFGDGMNGTWLTPTGTGYSCFVTNGCENTRIERLAINATPTGVGQGIDLNWDGSGSVGLKGNNICNCIIGGAAGVGSHGIRIGAGGFGGSNNHIDHCYLSGNVGLGTLAASAVCNSINGGNIAQTQTANIRMVNGSVTLIDGIGFQNPENNDAFDVMIDNNTDAVVISGCRSESAKAFYLHGSNSVSIYGCNQNGPNPADPPFPLSRYLDIANGKVIIDGGASLYGTFTGSSGTIYRRGGAYGAGFPGGFTGTIAQNIA